MNPSRSKKIVVKYNCLHCPHFATLAKTTMEGKMYCTADLMHEIKIEALKLLKMRKKYQDIEEPILFPSWCPLEWNEG